MTTTMTPEQQAFIDATVARAKAEILDDIANGTIDAPVTSFSDLHDHVDANEYGGMTEDEWVNKGNALFPRLPDQDDDTIYSEALTDACNTIQNAVHEWIQGPEFAAAA